MRLIIALFALFFLQVHNPLQVKAQQPDMRINVSASVINSVELLTVRPMNLSGADAENDRLTINPLTSANAGKMIAIGTPNKNIRISYLQNRELTHVQNNSTLIFNYSIAGSREDEQTTAEILDNENRDFKINDEGQFYIWIGGSVDVSNAQPGNYQGEFTLEIEYI